MHHTDTSLRATLRKFRSLSAEAQLLLSTQLLFNVGFYLVVPFIAPYLSGTMLVDGALIGLILGLRTWSQQGLFFLGGALADRFGIRPVLLGGIAIRISGFLCAGLATNLSWFILGVVLIGLGAALFSPAVESRLAALDVSQRGRMSRKELFAADTMFLNVGSVLGPVLGALLIPFGFKTVAVFGAVIFGVLFVAHALIAPRETSHPKHGNARSKKLWAGSMRAVRMPVFVALALIAGVIQASYHIQYLALPVEVERSHLHEDAIGWLFAAISVYVISSQMLITHYAQRTTLRRALLGGYILHILAFGMMAILTPLTPGDGILAWLPAIGFILLFHTGQMIVSPLIRDVVAIIAQERDLGAFYGLMSSVGGSIVLILSTAVGGLFDAAALPQAAAALPWAVVAGLCALATLGLLPLLARLPQEETSA